MAFVGATMRFFFKFLLAFFCMLPQSLTFAEEAPKQATNAPIEIPTSATDELGEESKPELVEGNRFLFLFVKMVLVLLLTLAIAVAIAFIAKRFFGGRFLAGKSSARIVLQEQKALSPKLSLYLVTIDSDEFALAETANSVTLLRHEKDVLKEEK